MTNHPNRNWRRQMEAAADQWTMTPECESLIFLPAIRPVDNAIRAQLREAYLAGYQDGRKSKA
jgi:hypothetical protein